MVDVTPSRLPQAGTPQRRSSGGVGLGRLALGIVALLVLAGVVLGVKYLVTETDWFVPVVIVAVKSLVMLVVLLICIAYILLADRKIWAAVQLRRGPNVVGPWGLFQSFADLSEVHAEGACHSGGCQ